MQKVEGSSPFSRFKSPANAGFFDGVPPGDATVTMQNVEGSNPACRCANTPHLLACPLPGVRNRDQTACLLVRFRIRSGNASRKGLAATQRAGHMTPQATSRP